MQPELAELRLWQLISPTLPVGAYAYSQGLEFAIENKWITDAASCQEWIAGQLQNNLSYLDVPILLRLQQAWSDSDYERVDHWNQYLLSSRETQELLDEDRQLGVALCRLLFDLNIDSVKLLPTSSQQHTSFATAFSLAAQTWQIPPANAARGFLWAWCENQVAAAVKLIPLGQTAGQKCLAALAEIIPAVVEISCAVSDDEIGSTSYGVAMASAFHETQYTRLFRS